MIMSLFPKFKTLNLAYNLFKLKFTRKKKPIFLSLFITNQCNLRCPYCCILEPSLPKEILQAHFSLEEIRNILDEFYRLGTRLVFLLGGEPMVHKHFDEIMMYLHQKSMLVEVLTNGLLIHKHIDVLKTAHSVCVSLDGIGEINDRLRGEGTYDKIVANIKIAQQANIKCRIHAVVTRDNLKRLKDFLTLAQEIHVPITFSPPLHVGKSACNDIHISDDEYREFWKEYRLLKEQGYPVGNTYRAIDAAINWPIGHHEIMMKDTPIPDHYRPIPCVDAEYYCGLSADGTLHTCIPLGPYNGPNIREMGVEKAWNYIVKNRPNCLACNKLCIFEYSLSVKLNGSSVLNALKFNMKQ